jgi:hypothetical protein
MRLKESDVVCWYPSAGLDYSSYLNWMNSRGNKLEPNVFLFTDNLYEHHILNGYENELIQFRNDFNNIDCHFELINVLSFFHSEKINEEVINDYTINNNYHHLSPNEYIDYMKCCGNRGKIIFKNQALFGGKELWIDGDLNLAELKNIISLGPIAGVSGFVNINNTNLTKDDFEGINVNRIYTSEDINIFPITCEGMASISFGDIKIVLIPFSNQEFFECLIKNSIKIDCLHAKRCCDNFEYINTLTSIGVKEAMLGTLRSEEDCLIVRNKDFRYKKVGEPFQAIDSCNMDDEIQIYNLLKEGVSDRAKLFVEQKITSKDDLMYNMIHYLLSERDPSENLIDFLKSTVDKDIKTQKAFEYFNILPPITEDLDDFIWAIIAFTKALFNEEQIEIFTLKEGLSLLQNNNKLIN